MNEPLPVYMVVGEGHSTLVFLHGLGGDHTNWQPQFAEFASDYRCVAWTLPGYGLSPPLEALTWSNLSDMLARVLDDIGVDRATIVGISMGGYIAANSWMFGIPFVALNPAINPRASLQKYIGTNKDFSGREYTLLKEVVVRYPDFPTGGGYGLVLCNMGDELLSCEDTYDYCKDYHHVICFPGGDHRFSNLEERLDEIESFYRMAETSYV